MIRRKIRKKKAKGYCSAAAVAAEAILSFYLKHIKYKKMICNLYLYLIF
jgi:hypothetical protein